MREAIAQNPIQGEQLFEQQQMDLLRTMQGFSSAADGQKQAIAHLSQVRDILLHKVPITQAEDFKQWILRLSTQVAKAVKELAALALAENVSAVLNRERYRLSTWT